MHAGLSLHLNDVGDIPFGQAGAEVADLAVAGVRDDQGRAVTPRNEFVDRLKREFSLGPAAHGVGDLRLDPARGDDRGVLVGVRADVVPSGAR